MDATFGKILMMGVPKPARFKPAVVCKLYAEAPFCTLLRPFADLRLRSFALVSALLRTCACFCVRPRLERPFLGTACR